MITVVIDISECFNYYGAEKKIISDIKARQTNAKANWSTKHEVKHGLLAASGFCYSLSGIISPKNISPIPVSQLSSFWNNNAGTSSNTNLNKLVHMPQNIGQCIFELDNILHKMLDTILTVEMAWDVKRWHYMSCGWHMFACPWLK